MSDIGDYLDTFIFNNFETFTPNTFLKNAFLSIIAAVYYRI